MSLLTLDLNLGFCMVRCPGEGERNCVCPCWADWWLMTHLGTGEQQEVALLQILHPGMCSDKFQTRTNQINDSLCNGKHSGGPQMGRECENPFVGWGRKELGVKNTGKWFSFLLISSSQHRLELTSAQLVKNVLLNQIPILTKILMSQVVTSHNCFSSKSSFYTSLL